MGYRRPVPSRTLDLLRKNILARLRERGERQGDLAQGVGKSDAWISQVLTGKRAIRLNLIDRVAEYFECDLDALFADRTETLPLTKPAMSGGLHVETRRTPRPGARPRIENSVDRLWEEFDRLPSHPRRRPRPRPHPPHARRARRVCIPSSSQVCRGTPNWTPS
jgi:transcriptional regulator with XRE-family HTH domain